MKPTAAFLAMLALAALLVPSATAIAQGKPKVCFTKQEETAEQLVRGGLRLREGALGCDGAPWEAGTKPLWDQVEQRFGAQFKQQTDIRRKAFAREFSKDAENREQMWDGRIVLHYRNYPLSGVYCAEIKSSLQDMLKKGWGVFASRAARAKGEVEMDYKNCS